MAPQSDPSRDRQELVRLRDELVGLLETFLEAAPLWRGTLYRMGRRCGQASCACTRGELHVSLVLTDRTLGPQRTLVPLRAHVGRLREMTRNYRRFRRARVRLGKIHRAMLEIIDRLEAEGRRRGQVRLPRARLLSQKQKDRSDPAERKPPRPP